ncbi:unnamed protein product (macronuclear) [Paramecium tetraurelia]|uniref:BHLH domain-containing protein n=1 Tax=Paramecium tetraurelia TaxID=5888 RepID=A0BQM3_PARTE|nr:uncharacterized protein GSPATT00031069001 [Paramecium tetraurelia]CAK60840.1 unnamed protein product [Paramecium tetraurelia]|eukprot:XP_001428238.1 hypothetical protein (macronuclear) [Paramecium tetraurelia strain d4-2]
MMRNGLEQICNQATNFWKQQLFPQQKQFEEASTNIGSNILIDDSIFEVSAKKTEDFLFSEAQKQNQSNEKCEEEFVCHQIQNSQKLYLEENSQKERDSFSCSESQNRKKEKKKSRTRSNKSSKHLFKLQAKQRLTISQEAFILEQTRKGTNPADIPLQIPGVASNQIKNRLMKKLKNFSKNNEFSCSNIADLIERIQKLQQEQDKDNTTKIEELRQHIQMIENHLNSTKQLILQKYMILFQQEQ